MYTERRKASVSHIPVRIDSYQRLSSCSLQSISSPYNGTCKGDSPTNVKNRLKRVPPSKTVTVTSLGYNDGMKVDLLQFKTIDGTKRISSQKSVQTLHKSNNRESKCQVHRYIRGFN